MADTLFKKEISVRVEATLKRSIARCLTGLIVVIAVAGCTAQPKIKYSVVTQPGTLTSDQYDSYAFQRSKIRMDLKKDAKGAPVSPLDLSVVSIPIEEDSFRIALARSDGWGFRTNVNITKFDNSDLVKEFGVEVIDSRVDLIKQVGGIVIALAGVVSYDSNTGLSGAAFPLEISIKDSINKAQVDRGEKKDVPAIGGNEQTIKGIVLDFDAVPVDAKPLKELPIDQGVGAFFYAACRSVLIKAEVASGEHFIQTVRVSDPRYYQSVALPAKGKVTMHSSCGASVSSDKDAGIKSSADIVDALVAQGKAIKEAIDAAKGKDGDDASTAKTNAK